MSSAALKINQAKDLYSSIFLNFFGLAETIDFTGTSAYPQQRLKDFNCKVFVNDKNLNVCLHYQNHYKHSIACKAEIYI